MTPDTLRAFRDELRLTQAGLASRLGVTRTTVAQWEVGRYPTPPLLGLALAAVRAGLDPIN